MNAPSVSSLSLVAQRILSGVLCWDCCAECPFILQLSTSWESGPCRRNKQRKSDYMRNIRSYPEVYKPFLIIVFVSVVQQFSGVSVIRAYSVAIFDTVFSNTTSYTNSSMMKGEGEVCHHTSSMAYISAIVIGLCRWDMRVWMWVFMSGSN